MVDLGEPNIFRKEIVVLTLISETKEIFILQMMCKLTDCVNCIITLLMINEN